MLNYTKTSSFINRVDELAHIQAWLEKQPDNLLFLYGPKSSGKSTLINKLVADTLSKKTYDLKHLNLRTVLLVNYTDFIKTFFGIDYASAKTDVKEIRQYDLKVFKLSVETLKGLDNKTLDPFTVMESELKKLVAVGIKPVIIIDELQALEGIYFNGQRELLKELFNFFVAITKESHLCHVIISSSDGYFIEKIYNDSKLKKTSTFLEIPYLSKDDVVYWLNNLPKESNVHNYRLTTQQIQQIWHTLGGSSWELSITIGEIMDIAQDGKVAQQDLDKILAKKIVVSAAMFEDYVRSTKHMQLFSALAKHNTDNKNFSATQLLQQVEAIYNMDALKTELNKLVQHNFLSYDPTNARYAVQGKAMELGLAQYAAELSL